MGTGTLGGLDRWWSLQVPQLWREAHRVGIERITAVRLEETSRTHDQYQGQLDWHGNLGDAPNPTILRELHFRGLHDAELRGARLLHSQQLLLMPMQLLGFALLHQKCLIVLGLCHIGRRASAQRWRCVAVLLSANEAWKQILLSIDAVRYR